MVTAMTQDNNGQEDRGVDASDENGVQAGKTARAMAWRFGVSQANAAAPVDMSSNIRGSNVEGAAWDDVIRWATDVNQGADEQREEAVLRIASCRVSGAPTLDLRNLRLSTLPTGLWSIDRQALADVDALYENAACVAFGSAGSKRGSEHVKGHLRQLLLDGNRLRVLPDDIGRLVSLRHLSLAHNQLTTLPDALARLSALSHLNVAANDLECLPDALGEATALEILRADGCLLRWVAPSLGNLPLLREFDLSDNMLTSLPDAMRWLPAACVVRLYDNPLPMRVRRTLRDGPIAPIWLLDVSPPRIPSRTLEEAAFAWLIASADRCGGSLAFWRRLAADHPAAARALTTLLDELGALPEASNGDTRLALRASVRNALKKIETDASPVIDFLTQTASRKALRHGPDDLSAQDDNDGLSDDCRFAVWTRTRWMALCATQAAPCGVGNAEDRGADLVAPGEVPRPGPGAACPLDSAAETTLRAWIDQFVLAHPLLDCADVLYACRMMMTNGAWRDRVRPQTALSPSVALQLVAPALWVMTEDDFADCARALGQTVPSVAAPVAADPPAADAVW